MMFYTKLETKCALCIEGHPLVTQTPELREGRMKGWVDGLLFGEFCSFCLSLSFAPTSEFCLYKNQFRRRSSEHKVFKWIRDSGWIWNSFWRELNILTLIWGELQNIYEYSTIADILSWIIWRFESKTLVLSLQILHFKIKQAKAKANRTI